MASSTVTTTPAEQPVAPAPPAGLVRSVGPIMATAVVIGSVIGSGIFVKPRIIAQNVPFSGLVALQWVLGGVLVVLGTLAYAEVAVLLPRAGGNYVFLREAYGRLFGFLWGWVSLVVICSASLAALATIFANSFVEILANPLLHDVFPAARGVQVGFWDRQVLTVATILGLGWINARGTRWGGGLQVVITTVKVGSLLFILTLPLFAWLLAGSGLFHAMPDMDNLQKIWPDDWSTVSVKGLGAAFLGILWAYHGWQYLTPIAAEVARPQRNLPLALLGGVGIVVFLYLGANLAYYLMLNGSEMAGLKEQTVASAFSQRLFGPIGGLLASAAVMCSVFGALNGNLLVAPRILYAMGEDSLAPYWIRTVHPRHRTPTRAIWVMALWGSALVLAVALLKAGEVMDPKKDAFDVLTDYAMFGAVIFETMAVIAIFVFRRKMPLAERPYRCPGYPIVPALYVILPAYMIGSMFVGQWLEAVAGTAFVLLGVIVYYALGLNQISREPLASANLPPSSEARD